MLNIQSISKTFNPGTVNAKQALSGLSLHLDHGDFVTIIGSNGAGKSTLFNAIAGSFYVDDGFIELDGEDITYMPEHKRSLMVGRLFQDPLKGTAPGMTIEENLALAYLRTAKGKSPFSRISKKDKDAFRERLSLLNMGLEDRMTQPVGLLSGGQRQALTLLMATLITPKLLRLYPCHHLSAFSISARLETSTRKPSCAAPSKASIGPSGASFSGSSDGESANSPLLSPVSFDVVSKLAFLTSPSGFCSIAART